MNRLLSFQSRCMQSVIRLNEAVVAIIAAVDNIDSLRLRIAEDEEIVVQEVHLMMASWTSIGLTMKCFVLTTL